MSTSYRYGFYLRPDLAMSRAQSQMHRILRAQYGLVTAGLFMPHATIKGFFRSDAEVATMRARLDAAMAGWQPFTVYNNGVVAFGPRSIVISVRDLPDGSPNLPLFALQERAWEALAPLIHPDCDFSPGDPRGLAGPNPFHPHLTLAMADLRPELRDELLDFIQQGGLVGPAAFTADTCHLFRFEAEWAGAWWATLRWELLASWRASAIAE